MLLVMCFERGSLRSIWDRRLGYAKSCVPFYGLFFLFGPSIPVLPLRKFLQHLHSYFHHRTPPARSNLAREVSSTGSRFPRIPRPPRHTQKSIFLFDPLIILAIVLSIWLWKRLRPKLKAYIAASCYSYLSLRPLHPCGAATSRGRPIRLHRRRNGRLHFRPAATSLPQRTRQSCLDGRPRAHRHQRRHSSRVAGVLALARNLSTRNARPSNVRHLPALQKHHRLRTGKNERLGIERRGHDPGPHGTTSTSPPGIFCPFSVAKGGRSGRSLKGHTFENHPGCASCFNNLVRVWANGLPTSSTFLQRKRTKVISLLAPTIAPRCRGGDERASCARWIENGTTRAGACDACTPFLQVTQDDIHHCRHQRIVEGVVLGEGRVPRSLSIEANERSTTVLAGASPYLRS